LRISDTTLRRELWQSLRTSAGSSAGIGEKLIRSTEAKPTIAERRLLELLFSDEELRQAILPRLDTEDYDELATAGIFRALVEVEREGLALDFEILNQKTEGDMVAFELLPMLLMGETPRVEESEEENRRMIAERCVDALRLMKVDRRISELGSEIAAAERSGNVEQRDKLALEHLELARLRSALLPKAQAMQIGH
jgi:hypothetical protein